MQGPASLDGSSKLLQLPPAGTCTRCPTEVRLRAEAPAGRKATIKLRRQVQGQEGPDGSSLEEIFVEGIQEIDEELEMYMWAADPGLLILDG
jgi:hypothetical protein